MTNTPTVPSAEELALFAQIVREVVRSRRLAAEDAKDFEQTIHLRLIQRDYDVFRRFTGRSSLRTYLRVVVNRMLLDWRNTAYGKWRPSATATRLGDHGIALERLIYRDGYTAHQAIETLAGGSQSPSTSELLRLLDQLPRRQLRRRVPDETLESHAVAFEDPIDEAESRVAMRRMGSALATALRQLSREDRRLIYLRFQQKRSVRTVAQLLHVDPRVLYRRFDRLLRSLRQTLLASGVTDPPFHARRMRHPTL